ncbi:esterase [Bailinhaonella thermotolerans]|uniref:Esterase n=1 Tax=Bailinhaonella thermotolerans TaxID=1070861 RepID=A0A3A4A853_9ACTN|nr:esterase [Bailinhaonella thermotolerans]RJL24805.1 esterase [Bailinhaonella thermotolerans]
MRRDVVELWSPSIGAAGALVAYGHWGRPVLAFPAGQGRAWDFEDNGLVGAVSWLIDAGRLKLYCVDGPEAASWPKTPEDEPYAGWLLDQVVPWIHNDCAGPLEIVALGCAAGAPLAAARALARPDLFPQAICLSGVYDPVPDLGSRNGPSLDWLRRRVHLLLLCAPQEPASSRSTVHFAELLARAAIPHTLEIWPHDTRPAWPTWRAQLAHHLPRFC